MLHKENLINFGFEIFQKQDKEDERVYNLIMAPKGFATNIFFSILHIWDICEEERLMTTLMKKLLTLVFSNNPLAFCYEKEHYLCSQ